MVRAAAPSHHVQLWQRILETRVAFRQVLRVADVERHRLVQLRVALGRGVRPQRADSLQPGFTAAEHVLEMRRMGALDAEVGGIPAGLGIDLLDGGLQRLTRREAAVGLDGERDRDRDGGSTGRQHDADGLLHVIHRDRAGHVGRRTGEHFELARMVVLGFWRRHRSRGNVAVSSWTDAAADHDWSPFALVRVGTSSSRRIALRFASASCAES